MSHKLFIDIHTHSAPEGTLSIVSLYQLDTPPQSNSNQLYSVGLHPWYLNFDSWDQAKRKLQSALKWDQVVAFGEIGLDRVQGVEFSLQIEYFIKQLELFKNSSFKVCFIHCVRAWNDLLPLITPMNDKIFILHDFNSSLTEFEKMVQLPHLFFSLGQNFMRPQSKIHQFIELIPQNRIFFESDASEKPVEELYHHYIRLIQGDLSLAQLSIIVEHNYQMVFS